MAEDYARDYPRETEMKARSMTLAERLVRAEERINRFDDDLAAANKMLASLHARVETAENELGINR